MVIEVAPPPLDFPYDDPSVWPYFLYAADVNRQRELYFVGLDHFNKSSNDQLPTLIGLWEQFAARPFAPERMTAIHEGGRKDIVGEPPEESLRRDGEHAYVANLAWRSGVPYRSGEPYDYPMSRQLVDQYGSDVASYFEYMKFARQYINAQEAGAGFGSFDLYVRSRPAMEQRLQFDIYNFSPSSLQQTHEQFFPDTPFDPMGPLQDGSFRTAYDYRKMFWPIGIVENASELTPMQEVGLFYDQIRDNWLIEIVQFAWETGNSIFDTHGVSHAVALEPYLPEALGVTVERYVGAVACQQFIEADR